MSRALGPEALVQIAVRDFAKVHQLPFIHIPNEGKRSWAMNALLKRMGLWPGASDCFMPRSNGRYKGLFLELKAGKNKPTPEQFQFLDAMRAEDYYATWCQGTDAAIEIITDFYLL